MRHFDVVILGAGPAGATTALALRKNHPHLSVVMVEACNCQAARPGEILTEKAVPILQQLDVLDFFLEQNHPRLQIDPSLGGGSAVGSGFHSALLRDGGWYLDRIRFDGMLAGDAAASGASFIRAIMSEAHFTADNSWKLVAQSARNSHILNAAFVVDATGCSARFASEIGVPQTAHDTLVGIGRVIALESGQQVSHVPLIEAFEHGWWYSAPTSDNRLAVVAMTDADICKRLQLTHVAHWREHLQASQLTHERVANLKISGDTCVRAAHTRCLRSCSGKNWLAVGDAATSVDPISSHGIARALRFGVHASDAIGEYFNSRQSNLNGYEAAVQAEFEKSMILRTEIYRSELRWENAPFWRRRQSDSSCTPRGWAQWKSPLSISNGTSSNDGFHLSKHTISARTQH